MGNWYKQLTAQTEGQRPKFYVGDNVRVNDPKRGFVLGMVQSVGDYVDGEWQYTILVDDLNDSIVSDESNMESDNF